MEIPQWQAGINKQTNTLKFMHIYENISNCKTKIGNLEYGKRCLDNVRK